MIDDRVTAEIYRGCLFINVKMSMQKIDFQYQKTAILKFMADCYRAKTNIPKSLADEMKLEISKFLDNEFQRKKALLLDELEQSIWRIFED